ncbi:MAG: cupin domain-containing protein [Pelovirga sp.]
MKVVSLDQVPQMAMAMEGAHLVSKQVPVGKEDGAPTFSFRVFTIAPGGHTPYHVHASEHLNYVIAGQGAVVNEAGEQRPIKAGDFALVLPNEKHQYRNASTTDDFKMICAVPGAYE